MHWACLRGGAAWLGEYTVRRLAVACFFEIASGKKKQGNTLTGRSSMLQLGLAVDSSRVRRMRVECEGQ